MMIFLVGSLLGLFLGALLCIRFIRQEVTADISPRLKRIQSQLDLLEAEVALALNTRYAELAAQLPPEPRRPL
jgi:ABC-type lipoprotein release transport system permease subunit